MLTGAIMAVRSDRAPLDPVRQGVADAFSPPPPLALSLLVAVTASVGLGARPARPIRAPRALVAAGPRRARRRARRRSAVDAFEAALAVDPAATDVYPRLAEAARASGLQGKAIRYYREALEREPDNLAALSGEGAALVEKGAVEKAAPQPGPARSRLCGGKCAETRAARRRDRRRARSRAC